MNTPLLDKINLPSDLKSLGNDEIQRLADEIRGRLVEISAERGGHLASNLGVVELTLAIHRVFDSPKDHIIFDVGHQAYVHKLITGRRDAFDTLRTTGGLSGFTARHESEHDPFGAGHSSTSVSAGLGFAEADRLRGNDAYTVCVLGDGAYTGGMVHEAINNISPDLPLIIVLNENGMSISLNRGAFASYLSRVRISGKYRAWKSGTANFLSHIPLIGKPLRRFAAWIKRVVKNALYESNYFEDLGLYYVGPIDGNDYSKIEEALRIAREAKKATVLHIKTVKGKGYAPAEQSPDGYHSVGKSVTDTFHSVFADKLCELAERDGKITAVTAAMGIGTGLDGFGERFPDRYFDVGIAEGHALTFSAGLAACGLSPFVAIYSTFLQRGYDSILHDIALQDLPVKIMIDRAGLALCDGATHHGIFDVAFISHIPKMTLLAPLSYASLRNALDFASAAVGPVAIRYSNSCENAEINGRFRRINSAVLCDFDITSPPEYIFITYGKLTERVVRAEDILLSRGILAGVAVVEKIKPYAEAVNTLLPILKRGKRVVYAEEGIKQGGAAENTLCELIRLGFDTSSTDFIISAIDDNFASPRTPCDLYDYLGLSPERLSEAMLSDDRKNYERK